MTERLLLRAEVQRRTGLSRSSIYARIAAGTFPAPRREPGARVVRWLESEIDAWVSAWVANAVVGTLVGSRTQCNKKAA